MILIEGRCNMFSNFFTKLTHLFFAGCFLGILTIPASGHAINQPEVNASAQSFLPRSPGAALTFFIKPEVDPAATCAKNDPCDFHKALLGTLTGDTLIFMEGTYTMASMGYTVIPRELISFSDKSVTLYGGWDGDPTLGVAPVIDPKKSILDGENLYRIMTMRGPANQTVIEGFTIRYGYAETAINEDCHASSGIGVPACGGAIYVDQGSSPTIQNNLIISNVALNKDGRTGIGGGIYAYGSPAIKILDNEIYANSASSSLSRGLGGAIYLNTCEGAPKIMGNNFWFNRAALSPFFGEGATIGVENSETVTISGNLFYMNNLDGNSNLNGTAIISLSSSLNILDNIFGENVNGSVVFLQDSSTNMQRNNLDNPDANYGLEIERGDAFVANNIIVEHKSSNVDVFGSTEGIAYVSFFFNTVAFSGTAGADHGYVIGDYVIGVFSHGIVANQTQGFYSSLVTGSLEIGYNLMHNNYLNYGGNLGSTGYIHHTFSGDPLFVNPANGNYHIQFYSAARDKGPGDLAVEDDIDHQRRPNASTTGWPNPADLGADEYCLPRYFPFIRR
jgi:hypothetical protein